LTFYLETPFNRATAVFCSYRLKLGRRFLKFQNYFLPVIFRSVKYALQTIYLLLLTQATYLRWLSRQKTHINCIILQESNSSHCTSEGNVGKKAIDSFAVCLPCYLLECPALISSFILSDRTISEGGKSTFYDTPSYSLLLANNLNFLVQQQISMAENEVTCNSWLL
jgi:hypothetical protein